MIVYCGCSHEYQDKKYGRNMRVHNPAVGRDGGVIPRCTVCLIEKAEQKRPEKAKS